MEPLSEEFLLPTFQAGLKKNRMPIKQLLLAGRLVEVGNIYASEVLFLSGIRPTTVASRIGAARVHKPHQAIVWCWPRAVEMGEHTARLFECRWNGGPLSDGSERVWPRWSAMPRLWYSHRV